MTRFLMRLMLRVLFGPLVAMWAIHEQQAAAREYLRRGNVRF